MSIKSIYAREILNSNATASIEVTATLEDGATGISSVPFGASAGKYEAQVLFDEDHRYRGKGMLKAVEKVNLTIREELEGLDAYDQKKVDERMIALDGTPNKSNLGANAILGVSLAVARAAATSKNKPLYKYLREDLYHRSAPQELPKPMIVVIEGGVHADNSTDFQEYLVVPDIKDSNGQYSPSESIRAGAEVYLALKEVLKQAGYCTNIGNEGAYAPEGIRSNEEPWEHIINAIQIAGYVPGEHIKLAADPASTQFATQASSTDIVQYQFKKENKAFSPEDLISYFENWIKHYPFLSLEDILAEDDWENWALANERLGKRVRLIGDDLLVTSKQRLERAIKEKSCNGIIIKPNQIGTLSETVETMETAQSAGFWTVVSHRGGGETNDTFMIDLAVGCGAAFIKCGIARGERVVKFNRLMAIEQELRK